MNIKFYKPVTEKDRVELYELVKEVISPLSFYSDRAREKEIEKFTASNIEKFLEEDTHHCIVLKDETDKMRAFVFAYEDGDMTFIIWYGVSNSARGKGYGKAILNHLEDTSSSTKLWCDTNQKNIPSNILLTKLGYKRCAELNDFWYGHDYYLWELKIN